jgi:hypothetical protein
LLYDMPAKGIVAKSFYLEENMESPQPVLETPAKKNRTLLIIAAVAIVLCCGCLVLAIAGYYGYTRMKSTQGLPPQPVENPVPVIPSDSQSPTLEPSNTAGDAPTGGLGNDILRNDTWQYAAAAARAKGCDQPIGADTKIVVLQQPQNGVWVEEWTIACASGDSYPFEITFTLDATGAKFDIKSLP